MLCRLPQGRGGAWWSALVVAGVAIGAEPAGAQLTQRVANSTAAMPADPGPPEVLAYTTEDAFPGLGFTDPVALVTPPGETNRLFVVERAGRVQVITNLASLGSVTFLDIRSRVTGGTSGNDERGLLGLAFHPAYASNGYFYVFYTGGATSPCVGCTNSLHDIVARYTADPADPNAALFSSEHILIRQRDEASNHNGGDLHFGPDGYLYVALGDEGGANDSWNNSQLIDRDLFSGIARIDVDLLPGSLAPTPHPSNAGTVTNYAIPADNPYIGATNFNGLAVDPGQVRTELYAVGLRNPWRMSFDRPTGRLYCGDVGQGAREEVDVIERGGNYGWAFREGTIAGPKAAPPQPEHVVEPILDYGRGTGPTQGNVITGGIVYRGSRLPELVGRYVFADFSSCNVWSLLYDGSSAAHWTRLAAECGISAFGRDPRNGDVLMTDISEDRIKRLVRNTNTTVSTLPATLDDTGLFADLQTLTPQPGVVPYDVNLPLWSDGAIKTRWFCLPDTNQFMGFQAGGSWTHPAGALWVKHFELELTNGVPSSRRRMETRVLVRNTGGVYGVTYRWGTSRTNAQLVADAAGGVADTVLIDDSGIIRTQVWQYPSRADCLQCHTPEAGLALSFNTPQMNRDVVYGAVTQRQIEAISGAGYFDSADVPVHALPALAHPSNELASVGYRARSYLQVNCGSCHTPGPALWDARLSTPLDAAGIVDGELLDPGTNPMNRVVAAGTPGHSMVYLRASSLGPDRMPPLASSLVDTQGVDLLNRWILDLASYQSFAQWQVQHFGSTNAEAARATADPDGDGALNDLEYLTGTDPTNDVADSWGIDGLSPDDGATAVHFEQLADRGFVLESTTNLQAEGTWRAVDSPGNSLFYAATNTAATITDDRPALDASFYRFRVYGP